MKKQPLASAQPQFGRRMSAADVEFWRLYQADLHLASRKQPPLDEARCQELVQAWRQTKNPGVQADCRERLILGMMPQAAAMARTKSGNGVDLSELVQLANDKLVSLLPSAAVPPTEDNFYRFATRAITNVFRDCFKKELLPKRRNALSTCEVPIPSTGLAAEQLAQSKEGIGLLEQAIQRLSPDDRRVIEAILDDKASGDPLAEVLGTNVAAAQMRKTRALRRLAALLKPEDGIEDEATGASSVRKSKHTRTSAKTQSARALSDMRVTALVPAALFDPDSLIGTPQADSPVASQVQSSRTLTLFDPTDVTETPEPELPVNLSISRKRRLIPDSQVLSVIV